MAEKKTSVHAATLLALGFRPYTPEEEAYYRRRVERQVSHRSGTLNHEEKRILEEMAKEPTFLVVKNGSVIVTIANDETGNHWTAQRGVDLTFFGFESQAPFAHLLHAQPELPPDVVH